MITGGKFANGAITAAFSRAFNQEAGGHSQQEEEATWKAKGYIRGILGIEYDGSTLEASLKPGKFGLEVAEDGGVTVTQGSSVIKRNILKNSFGAGVKWRSISITGTVNADRTIAFTGKLSLPAYWTFGGFLGDFSISHTRTINVDSALMDGSGFLSRAARGLRDRPHVVDCASGWAANCGD